jgi:hypothetical protein
VSEHENDLSGKTAIDVRIAFHWLREALLMCPSSVTA